MALLWPAFGPDLGNRSSPPKCNHSTLHVGQIIIPHVPDVGRILADNMFLSGDSCTIAKVGLTLKLLQVYEQIICLHVLSSVVNKGIQFFKVVLKYFNEKQTNTDSFTYTFV